jgi:hypothetical protein
MISVIIPTVIELAQDGEEMQWTIDAQAHTIATLKDMVKP